MAVRVRYAPSPTGILHLGGLRTALYNSVFARQNKGTFICRIEDTDRTRFKEGSADKMLQSLSQCGLEFDEGPGGIGGAFGPYVQSERIDLYKEAADKLLSSGSAYRCWCSSSRLKTARDMRSKLALPPIYDRHCLHLTDEQKRSRLADGSPYVIRMRVPDGGETSVLDTIRGRVSFQNKLIDDQILMKSDGFPTYHLASIVDDHNMKISHVIRGEEWLSSTPKHMILYQQLGLKPPRFSHLPLLLNSSRLKLSKRDDDVKSVDAYLQEGVLPEALLNFVATMGWHPSESDDTSETGSEVFSVSDLVERFALDRVQKAGAVVDERKLMHLSHQHLQRERPRRLLQRLREHPCSRTVLEPFPDDYVLRVLSISVNGLHTLAEFASLPLFRRPELHRCTSLDPVRAEMLQIELMTVLPESFKDTNKLDKWLRGFAAELQLPLRRVVLPLRILLTGLEEGPGVPSLLFALGREAALDRVKTALAYMEQNKTEQ